MCVCACVMAWGVIYHAHVFGVGMQTYGLGRPPPVLAVVLAKHLHPGARGAGGGPLPAAVMRHTCLWFLDMFRMEKERLAPRQLRFADRPPGSSNHCHVAHRARISIVGAWLLPAPHGPLLAEYSARCRGALFASHD